MYELQTFQTILSRMLERVPADIDKREGSIIYDALAPAAWELAGLYTELDINLNLSFADTATGEYLERRTLEFGIQRKPASKARRKALFYGSGNVPFDIPIGSRFSGGALNYTVIKKLSTGVFEVECEVSGAAGNQYFGTLLPISYMTGLSKAELSEVLVPGEDVETDASLRQRYFTALNEQPFGGNVADYKKKISDIPGIGGVKVFPVLQGGGTVKCTIISADHTSPSSILVNDVQTIIDPTVNSGEGLGFAPIGHHVTVVGVETVIFNVETSITLESGMTLGQVRADIEAAIEAYMLTLRQSWMNEAQLVVRVSQIESRILTVAGVTDISSTLLNGAAANITLTSEQIPVLGKVSLSV
ncbi:baseplate J/gp47 family protein [Paenibacillus sp. RC67]|uniref:baseplate J/gp47 family protein n=1 Tax=Paenibacillus sp. RC67 TaxID=3039392 RepID=UPI0024AE4725|nr:baseplate J/gp47 family protein [Paenibacillus sp. RC67]